MALLGCVYTIDRHIRSPEDVVESLFKSKKLHQEKSDKSKPCNKHVRASLLRDVEDKTKPAITEIFNWMQDESCKRDPNNNRESVIVMDGQENLWNAAVEYLCKDNSVMVLDLMHALERVWDASNIFHKTKDGKVKFVKQYALKLLKGEVNDVIKCLKRFSAMRKLNDKQNEKIEVICNYFSKNASRMKYDEYLSNGYPIASGAIEGACGNLVKDRMERSGMRWVMKGAQSLLNIRSIKISNLWGDFISFWIKRESIRLYGSAGNEIMRPA